MTRGGLGRLEETISASLVEASRKDLTIEKVSEIPSRLNQRSKNTTQHTWRKDAHGIRIAGSDGAAVSQRVSRLADRVLRRISTVAERLDAALSTQS